jgi:pimeloyl-ACP methyl ester carboxylesterase
MTDPSFLAGPDGRRLAYRIQSGRAPTVVFLAGFASDMSGAKAEHLARWCEARGQAFLRFDYSGHGASAGALTEGSIGHWREDALAVIDAATDGKLLLVGSSMGGWIGLLVALARADRIAGFIGLAAAPDFTEALMWAAMTPAEQAALWRLGTLTTPSEYGPPLKITRQLIEEGRQHLLLSGPIPLAFPVRLLHGQRDRDVPWEFSLCLSRAITGNDVQVTLIKHAQHRLSRPEDLALIERTLSELLGGLGGEDGV